MDIREIKHEYKESKRVIKENYHINKKQIKDKLRNDKNELVIKQAFDKSPLRLSVLEEVGNAITHGIGSIFSIVAFVLMLLGSDSFSEIISATVYFFGLFTLFTMSCLYHSFKYGSKVKKVFRRFDYSSIYLLIGATFAPVLLVYIGGVWGIVFFTVQWAIITLGVTMIGVFGPSKLKWLHFPLYLMLGWSALLFMPQMLRENPVFFFWILGGGLAYTLGTIPFKIKRHVAHFIWHFFVLAGAVIQWFGIYLYIYLN